MLTKSNEHAAPDISPASTVAKSETFPSPAEFLETIFAGITPEETICVSRMMKGGYFINASHDARANRRVMDGVDGHPGYFNISTVARAGEDDIYRRTSDRCIACYAIVLDDIGKKVDPDIIPVLPDWRAISSPGNEQWGYFIERTEELEKVSQFVQWLAHKGYTDPGAKGFNRLMRLPRSVHATAVDPETGEPWRTRVIEWDQFNNEEPLSLDDLIREFGCTPEELAALPTKRRVSPGSPIIKQLAVDAKDELLQWLSDNNYLLSDPDPDREWVDIICPWHELHSNGGLTAGYSPLGYGKPDGTFMDGRQFKCFHAHSLGEGEEQGMKTWGNFIEWAVSEGAPGLPQKDPVALYAARYAWVNADEKYLDMDVRGLGNELLSKASMDALFEGRMVLNRAENWVKAINMFNQDPRVKKFAAREFNPSAGEEKMFSKPKDDRLYYNTFVRPRHAVTTEPPAEFLKHMEYLIPIEDERETFLDWLAHKVQQPGKRSFSVLMVTDGGQGVGRSVIGEYLEAAWPLGVATTELATLLGKGGAGNDTFNDWHVGKMWGVVNEARAGIDRDDFYRGYESFKEWVDSQPRERMTNSKYGAKRMEKVWFNLLMFSNHIDALHIPSDDRRVMVIRNPDKRKSKEEYDPLWGELREGDGGSKLYWWLMNRDIEGFDNVYPPDTEAKAMMIEAGVSQRDDISELAVDYLKKLNIKFMSRVQLDVFVGAVAIVEFGHDAFDRNDIKHAVTFLWKREFVKIGDDPSGTLKVRIEDVQARYRGFRLALADVDLGRIDVADVQKWFASQSVPILKGDKIRIAEALSGI